MSIVDDMTEKPNHNACFICFQTSAKCPDISLHRFPANKEQRTVWLKICGLSENDYKSSRRICSRHFEEDCFNKYNFRKCLYPGSIPTINVHGNSRHSMLASPHVMRRRYNAALKKGSRSLIKHLKQVNHLKHINGSPYVSPNIRLLQNKSPPPYVSSNIRLPQNVSHTQYDSPSNIKIPQNSSPVNNNNNPPTLPKEKPFCPNTMFRYDNVPKEYSTIWVCRICKSALLSKNAAQKHFSMCKLSSDTDEDEVDEEFDDNS